jgi:2-hydroxy-6-oxonona-2,4-dienedioate hydrolase
LSRLAAGQQQRVAGRDNGGDRIDSVSAKLALLDHAISQVGEGVPMSLEMPKSVEELDRQATRFATPCGVGTMVWRRWGAGSPLLLFHGGSGSWTHWSRNIEALARHREVWVPDLPAFGESAAPPEPITVQSYAAIVAAGIVELMQARQLAIAGFSLGSHLAEAVAAARPEQVGMLVLARGNFGVPGEDPGPRLRKWRNVGDKAEREAALRHNLATLMVADPAIIDDAMVRMYDADLSRSRLKPGIFRASRDTGLLKRLPMPVCCIAGEYDVYGLPSVAAQGEALHRLRPGTPFHIIGGAGHWVIYEAADRFNELLLQALGDQDGASGPAAITV